MVSIGAEDHHDHHRASQLPMEGYFFSRSACAGRAYFFSHSSRLITSGRKSRS
jgi:hypothetical protein